jgi:hypothetical protein
LFTGRGAFRYIQVADTPIIPEPTGNSLAATAGGLLACGFFARRRRRLFDLAERTWPIRDGVLGR